ncbi:MAG: Wzy polymerase domain-containing protein [Pseudomonadota bacterium]|uniref:PglL family O-oligosaccharyltransferase n=1 Tax=Ralstonia pickettii TaxID=329 RepID=UPI001BE45C33|nr:Wzy polymerase domain-containing protein [Ralstonia pickettii]MBT2179310.1 O-antigen ligase C-terminal domain-containing protein [Ralstonia pickettii]MEA3268449.1 Wzy polymerase domain-containing protein [Pseudomonadota bacterium]
MLRSRVLFLPLWLSIAACGAVPYLIALHTLPMPTFYSEFATGVCWAATAVVVLALTWGSKTGLPKVALAPLALIAVLFVQLAVAPPLNPFMSLAATVFLLGAVAACVLGTRCRSFPGVLEALALGLILGGLLTVAIELLQLFRVPNSCPTLLALEPGGAERRMWGNMNQPNHVASYLAFGLAACAFFASKFRRTWILFAVIAFALMLGMSLTVSRVTWLYIAVIGGLGGLQWTTGQRGPQRWLKACVPLVTLVLGYQICNWLVSYANILWHLDLPMSLGERMQQGVGLRPLLWKHAWHMFLAHPWLGGGWGDYAWNQYVQTDTLGHVEMSLNAHNIVLDQLAKVGLLGLLAIALPLLSFAWSLRKRKLTPALAFLLTIVLVIGAHSMVEYPLHYAFFLLPCAFALGYVDERNLRVPSASMTWTATAAITVVSAALMSHLWGDYKAVERLHYAPDGMQKELALYSQHGPTLLLPYEHLAMAFHFNVVPDMASSLAKLELQAMQFYPGSATVQRYALALAYLGKTDEAMVHVRRMRNHYWTNYAEQSWLFTQACDKHGEDKLKTFCTRLRAENLLVPAAKPSVEKAPSASQ